MMDIKQLVTLKKQGKSNRQVALMLQVNRNTVNEYVKLISTQEGGYDGFLALEDSQMGNRFMPLSEISRKRYEDLSTLFENISIQMRKTGCTLLIQWKEYQQKFPDGYSYTQFVHHYKLWAEPRHGSGKLIHKVGEKVMIDYTGKKLSWVNQQTGEVTEVEVFVGILPSSQYTYVEASCSQKREDLVDSMRRCLEYFSGVPQAIVSDNLKSAVSKSCKYEPEINKTLKDFALHYGCVIDPARPYHPQDKALVEGAVKIVYQRIFYPLSKHTFFSLAELNKAIAELLVDYNATTLHLLSYSRREIFLSTEKSQLSPLPPTPYEIKQFKRSKVQKMGYIFLSEDKHYYSAPHRYIGKELEVRYSQNTVELFYNHERLCTHQRNFKPGQYTSIKEHLSSAHKAYGEWSLPFFQQKAKSIGVFTEQYISKLILAKSYPEIGYKQAFGIIHLTRLYEGKRIEKACELALPLAHVSYKTIENILKNKQDQACLVSEPITVNAYHENIRGASQYF